MIFNFLFRPELLWTEATGQDRRLPFGGSILLLHATTGIHDSHGKRWRGGELCTNNKVLRPQSDT